jgi:hypothetical protein
VLGVVEMSGARRVSTAQACLRQQSLGLRIGESLML